MNIKLNYTEKGDGYPLILLHGNGQNSNYFANQLDYFSSNYRVIAVDTRGHGKSKRGHRDLTLDQCADDLKHFLNNMKIEKAHILGFSDGGNIALLFALKYPFMVDRLILNGADISTTGVKASFQFPVYIGYFFLKIISSYFKKTVLKKEILSLMIDQPNIKPAELVKITMPTLVIVGTSDIIKEDHSKLIADSIPNSSFIKIVGDHFISKKMSLEFNKVVSRFLKEPYKNE